MEVGSTNYINIRRGPSCFEHTISSLSGGSMFGSIITLASGVIGIGFIFIPLAVI